MILTKSAKRATSLFRGRTHDLDNAAPPFEGMLDCSWEVGFNTLGGSYLALAEHAFLDAHLSVLENAFGDYDLVRIQECSTPIRVINDRKRLAPYFASSAPVL